MLVLITRMRWLLPLLLAGLIGCDTAGPVAGTNTPETENPGATQRPVDAFSIVFGTPHFDEGRVLIQTADGDLMVAGAGNGTIAPADGTLPRPNLTRIGPDGTVKWTRIYDALEYGTAQAVVETSSESFVVLSMQHNDFFDARRLLVWQVDASGQMMGTLYERPHGYIPHDATQPVVPAQDGGYVLIGSEWKPSGVNPSFVQKISSGGIEQWAWRTDRNLDLKAVRQVANGGFVIFGNELVDPQAYKLDLFLLRLSADGSVLWERNLGDPASSEQASALVVTSDGGFLLSGKRYGTTSSPLFVLRLDAAGAVLWERSYDDLGDAEINALTVTSDGAFAFIGWTRLESFTNAAFVRRITSNGDVEWTQHFSKSGQTYQGFDVLALPQGQLVATGSKGPAAPTLGGPDYDTFVLTLDRDGNAPAP